MINILLENSSGSYTFLFLGLGLIVLMMVMTILPQRKRQKQMQEMISSVAVGTRVKTIGGLIGVVKEVKDNNTLVVDIGTEEFPTLIVIDKVAIYSNIDAAEAAAAAKEAALAQKKAGKGGIAAVKKDEEEKKIDE